MEPPDIRCYSSHSTVVEEHTASLPQTSTTGTEMAHTAERYVDRPDAPCVPSVLAGFDFEAPAPPAITVRRNFFHIQKKQSRVAHRSIYNRSTKQLLDAESHPVADPLTIDTGDARHPVSANTI